MHFGLMLDKTYENNPDGKAVGNSSGFESLLWHMTQRKKLHKRETQREQYTLVLCWIISTYENNPDGKSVGNLSHRITVRWHKT